MKKNLLLMMLCAPVILAAQNGVTVSGLAVDAGTVTFHVSWEKPMPVEVWVDSAWVFVDYNNNGVMERLPVTGATATAGTVTKISDNDKGVWVAGNARTSGSFSATVKLFTSIADVGGACAYASNYPPVGKYTAADKIEFTGTPDYKVILEKNDNSTYTATVHKDESFSIPSGETVLSFTDKTGAPGLLNCTMPAVQTLTASMAGYCEGTAGVQFALHNTESGVVYQLYRDNTPLSGATLNGSGSAETFSSTFAAGMYHAEALPGATCPAVMAGMHTITMYPIPAPPTIAGPSSACVSATLVAVPGDHGTGIRWTDNSSTVNFRTVTSSGTVAAISISANGCVSSSRSFVYRISVPAPAGSAPDPLCCCACGLINNGTTCTTISNTLTLRSYVTCLAQSTGSWSIATAQAYCPMTKDCSGITVQGFTSTYVKCSDASCFFYSSISNSSGGRCWQ
jgi:hypothetical protein